MQDVRVPGASAPTITAPVFLHIGAMKTGTTFLQTLLIDNQDGLAAAGYLFPASPWKRQVRAAQEVVGTSEDPVIQREAAGAWRSVVALMRAHTGAASIFSMEFLSHAAPDRVAWAFDALDGCEVHVVITVRDATSIIPAQWQTTVRSGSTVTWPEFMRGVRRAAGWRGRPGRPGRLFTDPAAWKFRLNQDVPRVLETWGRFVPAERLHVVSVPADSSDPRLLWERFAQVVGCDPELCPGLPPANESLGYASAELLRRVNVDLGEVPLTDYNATVREYLAGRVLAFEARGETRPRLTSDTLEFGLRWNRRVLEGIERSGARFVGEPADLPTSMTPRHERLVDEAQPPPSEAELLRAAGPAAVALRALVERRSRRARKQGVDLSGLELPAVEPGSSAGSDVPSWSDSDDPVASAIEDIADLCRVAIEVRRRIRS